jgi:hypothetical protein
MHKQLSPLAQLKSIDTGLCIINLESPNEVSDENLHRSLHKLKAPCLPIPEAWDLLKDAENHMLHMFQASYNKNLEVAQSEREAALVALRPLEKVLINRKIS